MAYCTIDDIKKLVPYNIIVNLSNDAAGKTKHNTTNVDEAIDQADREIDAYISCVTAVPVDPIPPLIANLSAKMAIWNLHLRKYFDSPVWRKTYEQCIETLEKIAQGKINISPVDIDEQSEPPGDVDTASRDQIFTDDLWSMY